MTGEYERFLESKRQIGGEHGFEPVWMPTYLYDFQRLLVEWAVRKGRGAIFADCGLGKTPMQLVWAENVVRKTGGRVLILTPLAVAHQTSREAEKFGIEAKVSRDGSLPSKIVITNYQQLDKFSPGDFDGCVCDESSILKHFTGATQQSVTRFMLKLPYRLLCTATAAPNDYIELGTSSEALGELSYSDMLSRFFRQLDDKGQKREQKKQDWEETAANHFAKLSYRVHQSIGQWRLKHHAVDSFWRWVCSWAMACRKPSDLGCDDGGFILPDLTEHHHIVTPKTPPEGMLFCVPAIGLREEREERRRTLEERCDHAKVLVDHDKPAVVWCHFNNEGDLLERVIPGARQVAGTTPDDEKIEAYNDFASGKLRVLVIKPKIGAWGMNWQHCAHVVTFASHSYEQFYQSVRRCWRFGQTSPVRLDVISTVGEERVRKNMDRKSKQASVMFDELIRHMNDAQVIRPVKRDTKEMELPKWV